MEDCYCLKKGFLNKSPPQNSKKFMPSFIRPSWRRRFFVLYKPKEASDDSDYILAYYTDQRCTRIKGEVNLTKCESLISDARTGTWKNVFSLKTMDNNKDRTYFFSADTSDEMEAWVNKICIACGMIASDDNVSNYINSEDTRPLRPSITSQRPSTGLNNPIPQAGRATYPTVSTNPHRPSYTPVLASNPPHRPAHPSHYPGSQRPSVNPVGRLPPTSDSAYHRNSDENYSLQTTYIDHSTLDNDDVYKLAGDTSSVYNNPTEESVYNETADTISQNRKHSYINISELNNRQPPKDPSTITPKPVSRRPCPPLPTEDEDVYKMPSDKPTIGGDAKLEEEDEYSLVPGSAPLNKTKSLKKHIDFSNAKLYRRSEIDAEWQDDKSRGGSLARARTISHTSKELISLPKRSNARASNTSSSGDDDSDGELPPPDRTPPPIPQKKKQQNGDVSTPPPSRSDSDSLNYIEVSCANQLAQPTLTASHQSSKPNRYTEYMEIDIGKTTALGEVNNQFSSNKK